ncbi:MAG: hypothetical protein AAF789_02350 [Bacteroidota bacterium]
MKKVRILTSIGSLLIVFGLFAQEPKKAIYPDTITMKFDEQTEIIFSFDRMSRFDNYLSNELWKSALGIMETTLLNSDFTGGKIVSYRKFSLNIEVKVDVKPLENSELLIIGADRTKQLAADRTEFLIELPEVRIFFYLNDLSTLEQVKSLSLESVWKQIEDKFEDQGKVNLYSGTGSFNYGVAQIDEIIATPSGKDNVEIDFVGIGLGFYRDRFVPDIGSKITFNLHNRLGEKWISFGIQYTQQYFFDRDTENQYQLDLNGWLTGFFRLDYGSTRRLGVGIGSVIHREGDFYEGATFKMSVYNSDKNSRLTFSPELIATNDFKQFFPAIRMGLSF